MPNPTSQPNRLRSRLATAPVKLAGFAALLIALSGTAALAGGAIDPDRERGADDGADPATPSAGGHSGSDEHTSAPVKARPDAAPAHGAKDETHPVRGLAVAENGLRLVVSTPELRRAHSEEVRFRIVDDRGETVRDFDVAHTKRMHVIVVRRDLAGFQHLHPSQNRDGSWTVAVRLPLAGSYRLFADFAHAGQPATLATELRVDGQADLQPLPPAATTAISDGGYEVRKQESSARPGQEASLRFEISEDGQAVQPEPYLGAGGHLVALREGDLAFLHVHPSEHGHGERNSAPHGEPIAFAATFPTAGRYRLFLQFKHQGTVHTVAFTQEVK
ncbi:MAG: hypothetical protein Q8K79_02120 [Solirubrobacteraceae bacterium]|nr:hypothetical protein [Solirubrobacteraceae bacterium]